MANDIRIDIEADDNSKRGLDSTEKGLKGVGDAAKKADSQLKGVGDAADGVGTKLKGVGQDAETAQQRLDRIGKGGADLRAYRQDLDGVGDGFNDVEDRAMGAGNMINGVGDMMTAADPATFAMGLSDTAAGMRYTLVPSLQDGLRGLKGLAEGFKTGEGAGGAFRRNMVGIGVATAGVGVGIALITQHFNDQAEAERRAEARVADYIDRLRTLQGSTEDLTASVVAQDDEYETLRSVLAATGMSTTEFSEKARAGEVDLRAMADAAGLNKSETVALISEYGTLSGAVADASEGLEEQTEITAGTAEGQKALADEIRGVADALAAQVDPAFAVLDAQNQLADAQTAVAEAQTAVNDAAREFGEGSPEHVAALEELRRARIDEVAAGFSQQQSLRELAAALQAEGMSVDSIIGRLQAMVGQNGVTQASVDAVAWSLRSVPGQIHSTLTADASNANWVLDGVLGKLRTVRSLASNIQITAARQAAEHQGLRRASGGVIGAAASGGVHGAQTLVGEHGPEIVNLPYGSTVIPAGATATMMGSGGGGGGAGPTVIEVRGDSAELVALIQSWIRNTYGGDVQAALGWGSR